MGVGEGTREVWGGAQGTGWHSLSEPQQPTGENAGLRVGVLGARGGVGASVFASSLARELVHTGRSQVPGTAVALVDLDLGGGGIDVVLGVEEFPGLRWADLGDARGEVPGPELLELMPRWGEVAVLSSDRGRPGVSDAQVCSAVLTGLAASAHLVLDLPRWILAGQPGEPSSLTSFILGLCDALILIVPRDLGAVAGAQAILHDLGAQLDSQKFALVVRGPAPGALDPGQISSVLRVPLATEMKADRGLAAAVERGVGPQGSHLRAAARATLEHVRHRHASRIRQP